MRNMKNTHNKNICTVESTYSFRSLDFVLRTVRVYQDATVQQNTRNIEDRERYLLLSTAMQWMNFKDLNSGVNTWRNIIFFFTSLEAKYLLLSLDLHKYKKSIHNNNNLKSNNNKLETNNIGIVYTEVKYESIKLNSDQEGTG